MGTGGRAAGRSPAEEEQVEAAGHASPGQELVAAAGCASWEKGGYGISPMVLLGPFLAGSFCHQVLDGRQPKNLEGRRSRTYCTNYINKNTYRGALDKPFWTINASQAMAVKVKVSRGSTDPPSRKSAPTSGLLKTIMSSVWLAPTQTV